MADLTSKLGFVGAGGVEGLPAGGVPIVEPVKPPDPNETVKPAGVVTEVNTGEQKNKDLTFKPYEFGGSKFDKDIKIPYVVRKKYEQILDTIAQRLQEYQTRNITTVSGPKLTEDQQEFLDIYKTQRDKLLSTADGWNYANSVIGDELFVRMAAFQKSPDIKSQGISDKPERISVVIHRGTARVVANAIGRAVATPFVGAYRFARSFNEKVEVVLTDTVIDTTVLPGETQRYIDYLGKIGMNDTVNFMRDATLARRDFNIETGTEAKKFSETAPLQNYRADPGSKPHETTDSTLAHVRNDIYKKIIREGLVPPGPYTALNENISSHRDWVSYEVLRRTQREFASTFLKQVVQDEAYADETVTYLNAKIADLSKDVTPEDLKSHQIGVLKAKITELEGVVKDGKTEGGKLQEIQTQLDEFKKLLTASESGSKSLEAAFQEKQSTYLAAKQEAAKSAKEQKRLEKLQAEKEKQKAKVKAEADKRIAEKKLLPTYVSDEKAYNDALKAYKKELQDYDKAISKIDQNRNTSIEDLEKQYEAEKKAGNDPKAKAIYNQIVSTDDLADRRMAKLTNEKGRIPSPEKSKRLQKYEEQITQETTQRDARVGTIDTELKEVFTDLQKAQKDLGEKTIDLDFKLKALTPDKIKRAGLLAKISKAEKDKKDIERQIEAAKKQLEKVEKSASGKLAKKRKSGKELLDGYHSVIKRWEAAVSAVESDSTLHQVDLTDLLDVNTQDPGYGKSYPKGYLNALDVLFEWNGSQKRSDMLNIALKILPPKRYAHLMYDFFDLGSVATPPSRNSLNAVLSYADTNNLFKNQLHAGRFFNTVINEMTQSANSVRESL